MKASAAGLEIPKAGRPPLVGTDASDQRQAKSEAFAACMFAAHEGLEHVLMLLLCDAPDTFFHPQAAALGDKPDTPLVGVVQGVAQQIGEHGAQQGRVVDARILPLAAELERQPPGAYLRPPVGGLLIKHLLPRASCRKVCTSTKRSPLRVWV